MIIAKVSRKFLVTIPKEVREALKLREGDFIVFIIRDGEVAIRKARIVTRPDSLEAA